MENTLIYDKKTDSIKQMPQNYIVAFRSSTSQKWVIRGAGPVIMGKMIAVLQSDGGQKMTGSQLVQKINNSTFPIETEKLKEGQEITINIPFTYIIGGKGYHTGKILWTIEDCKEELRTKLSNGEISPWDMFMDVRE